MTTSGGATATPKDALDPEANASRRRRGPISYERTFPAEMLPDGLLEHLSSMHVVQHGIDHNNDGDMTSGRPRWIDFRARNQGKPECRKEVIQPGCGASSGGGGGGAGGGWFGRRRLSAEPNALPPQQGPLIAAVCGFAVAAAGLRDVRVADDGKTPLQPIPWAAFGVSRPLAGAEGSA